MKRITILILSLTALLSCSNNEDNFLELDMTSQKAFLIPSETASCRSIKSAEEAGEAAADDVTGKYFTVRGLRFYWKHAYNSFTISLIRISFKNKNITGDEFSCDVAGDDLESLLDLDPADNAVDLWDGVLAANPNQTYSRVTTTTNCDIKCGGIETEDKSFVAGGRIDVIGFMTEPDGTQIPHKASTSFSIENIK
jgi:hypothetical protein